MKMQLKMKNKEKAPDENEVEKKPAKEPLIRITKRDSVPFWKAWLIRLCAVLAAFIVCAVVTVLLTKDNPFKIYATMFDGAFGTPRKIWNLLQDLAMLLCVALAVTPAFRMRFWNTGAEGQVLMGGLAAAACMISLGDKIPNALLILITFIACVIAGAVWAGIPAFFKAKWDTNETLFTLMMNYVAMQIISFFITKWEVPKGSGAVGIINQNTEAGWLPDIGGQKFLLNIIIVALIVVLLHVYLKHSKHGYEISVVGESQSTARYVGINVKKVIIRTMLLSGAICGIAGFLLVSGTGHTISTTTADGRGFTAIMVSWLAHFNPIAMILTSFLLVFLDKGAAAVVTGSNGRLNISFTDILSGIILFFIIGSEFFINYKINFRISHKEEKS